MSKASYSYNLNSKDIFIDKMIKDSKYTFAIEQKIIYVILKIQKYSQKKKDRANKLPDPALFGKKEAISIISCV